MSIFSKRSRRRKRAADELLSAQSLLAFANMSGEHQMVLAESILAARTERRHLQRAS